jgi:prepilin-type N-terminal cleavage/methylation domain-containing protein
MNTQKNNVYTVAYGISLIEMLVVLAISSVLLTGLMMMLEQMMRAQQSTDNSTSLRMRVATLEHRLQEDLSGIFVPVFGQKAAPKSPAATQKGAPTATPNQSPAAEPQQKEIVVFYAAQSEQALSVLSFITNNSALAQLAESLGKLQSRMARVTYSLVPDRRHAQSYRLVRQEIADITIPFDPTHTQLPKDAYEVINGIASFSATFDFIVDDDKKTASETTAAAVPKKGSAKKVKTVTSWDKEKEGDLPMLPRFIKVKLQLWSLNYKSKYTTYFYFEIPEHILAAQAPNKEEQQRKLPVPAKPSPLPQQPKMPLPPGLPKK